MIMIVVIFDSAIVKLINKSNKYQIAYSFLKDIERRKNVTELFIGLT